MMASSRQLSQIAAIKIMLASIILASAAEPLVVRNEQNMSRKTLDCAAKIWLWKGRTDLPCLMRPSASASRPLVPR